MENFSGYIAADELYDGPFCILSIVDNHNFKRLIYEVLDHSPTHKDIEAFFERFKEILKSQDHILKGITTDASPLYPGPINKIFSQVSHQICEFHTIKEINKSAIKTVAKVRRTLKKEIPKLPRGRPSSKADKSLSRKAKRLKEKIGNLFEHRYLFVRHTLTLSEKKTFNQITRGHPELRQLRQIIDEVYRLFDRRCKTQTALDKLNRLRKKLRRFKDMSKSLKKLFSDNIEKALCFLDDKLLPSTSNAVERGYRRYRKMQKSIYRVRTQKNISQRLALDLYRDINLICKNDTLKLLHQERIR